MAIAAKGPRTGDIVAHHLRRRHSDIKGTLFEAALLMALLLSLLILLVLLVDVFRGGIGVFQERGAEFLRGRLTVVSPTTAGVGQAIVGSLTLLVVVVILAFPIGIAAAIYLEEYASDTRFNRFIDVNIRNLAGVPSIVYGLLGLVIFVQVLAPLTGGKTAMAGGLTLAVLVLPIVIITSMEALRAVPDSIREAGFGVGATRWEVIRSHVLPAAAPGILDRHRPFDLPRDRRDGPTPRRRRNHGSPGDRGKRFLRIVPRGVYGSTRRGFQMDQPSERRLPCIDGGGNHGVAPDDADGQCDRDRPAQPLREEMVMETAITDTPRNVHINMEPRASNERPLGEPVFEVSDLAVYYGAFRAIRDVTLSVAQNQITALIGPSGCGKTTMLRCFNRMNDLIETARVEGSVKYHGADLYDKRVDPVEVRRRIGMVFQKPNPFPKSIYDNIAFGPKVAGYKGNMDDIVEESLQKAALWDEVRNRLKESAMSLSGGQQQRLCIARCIAVKPDVILMDEPCSALDPIATGRIEDLMQNLKDEFTIVVVTHNMQQAARVSDMTAFFTAEVNEEQDRRTGVLVEYDKTEQMFTNPSDERTENYVTGRFG